MIQATDKHGQKWDILMPTPDRLLESLQRRDRLEAAAKRAFNYLTLHEFDLIDLDEEEVAFVASIRLDLAEALQIGEEDAS